MLIYSRHPSWKGFLTEDILAMLNDIDAEIGSDFTPERELVLRFLSLDLKNIKAVILGQDPYKPAGVANGRSFQPQNLSDWTEPFRQVSLKNILRLVYCAYSDISDYRDIPKYSELVKKIKSGEFKIKPPKEWFDSLENQGVLFLNAALTCKTGFSGSHSDIWKGFSDKLIEFIARENPQAVWFLWGSFAASAKDLIGGSRAFVSRHPMMCSEKYEDDFLKNPCFKETMNEINWLGQI